MSMLGQTVLSVEDDDATEYVLENAFAEVDPSIRLERVSNGEEALAFLNKLPPFHYASRPNLILLDLQLPRENGLDVLAAIEADEALRSVPVIVFSSSSLESHRAQCLALGAKDYIEKPATYDGVIDAVRSACTRALQATEGSL
jgi:CheY-like chemotaxis protein